MIQELWKYHKMPLILLLSCCALYFSFAYDLERTDFPKLLTLYLALCFLSWKLFQMEKGNWKFLITACIFFRLIFLFSIPNLSQDFYRFLWDGELLLKGLNPYLSTPDELLTSGFDKLPGHSPELVQGMGSLSAGNHSNYPPLSQLIFALAALFSGKSIFGGIVVLRLVIISAEVGIFYFGRKLLRHLHLPENRIFLFLLNPFVIIELTGTLHFEGVMIFFLLWALYLLLQHKWLLAAVVFALSISIKLLPLIFLPMLFHYFRKSSQLGLKRLLGFYGVTALVCIFSFLPFLTAGALNNYLATTALWFQKFEFNASIYYLLRWVGYRVAGYNIIGTAGIIMGILAAFAIVFLSFLPSKKATPEMRFLFFRMLFGISIYYFLATTVHPWYLALPLILGVFTKFNYPLVWTLLVVLSYSAYSNHPYEENLLLVTLEYILVFGFLFFEFRKKNFADIHIKR